MDDQRIRDVIRHLVEQHGNAPITVLLSRDGDDDGQNETDSDGDNGANGDNGDEQDEDDEEEEGDEDEVVQFLNARHGNRLFSSRVQLGGAQGAQGGPGAHGAHGAHGGPGAQQVLEMLQKTMNYYRGIKVSSSIMTDTFEIVVPREVDTFVERLRAADNMTQAFLSFVDAKLATARMSSRSFSQMYVQAAMSSNIKMRKESMTNLLRNTDMLNDQLQQHRRNMVALTVDIDEALARNTRDQVREFSQRAHELLVAIKNTTTMMSVRVSLQETADSLVGSHELVGHCVEYRHVTINNLMHVLGQFDVWGQDPFLDSAVARAHFLKVMSRQLLLIVKNAQRLFSWVREAAIVSCAAIMRDSQDYETIVANLSRTGASEFVKISG